MGTIKQGILGGFSGKVGSVIGGSWKGISYMRGIALSISNPRSDGQLAQRAKWSVVMHFLQPITQQLRDGWRKYAIKMTAFNAAFKNTILNAVTGTYPNYAINYPAALVADGSLPSVLNPVAASTVAGTVLFTWDDNSDETGAADTDTIVAVVYNAVKNWAVTISNLADRGEGTLAVTVPSAFSGDLVHCYLYFNTVAGAEVNNVSKSKYAGAVTVA
jgi:hypothetical protein